MIIIIYHHVGYQIYCRGDKVGAWPIQVENQCPNVFYQYMYISIMYEINTIYTFVAFCELRICSLDTATIPFITLLLSE